MPIFNPQVTDQRMSLDSVQFSLSDSLRATAAQTFWESPTYAFTETSELWGLEETENTLSADDANARAAALGLKLSFDAPTTEEAFDFLSERKQAENFRSLVMQQSPSGVLPVIAQFATSMGVSLADPLNIATSFVPVARIKDFDLLMSAAKTAGSRAALRFRTGVQEGAVGSLMLEPLTYGLQQELQADYTMTDAAMNVAFGAFLGGTVQAGVGAYTDFAAHKSAARSELAKQLSERIEGVTAQVAQRKNLTWAQTVEPNINEPSLALRQEQFMEASPETREAVFRLAMAQALTGRVIDASTVLNADQRAVLGPVKIRQEEVAALLDSQVDTLIDDLSVQAQSEYLSKKDTKRLKAAVKSLKKDIEALTDPSQWTDFKRRAREELPLGTAKKKVAARAQELQKSSEAHILDKIDALESQIATGKDAAQLRSTLDRIRSKLKNDRQAAISELADINHLKDSLTQAIPENKQKMAEFAQAEITEPSTRLGDGSVASAVEVEMKTPRSDEVAEVEAEIEAAMAVYNERFGVEGEEIPPEVAAADARVQEVEQENAAAKTLAHCMMRTGA